MENTPRLMANGAPDPTVYRDNIHLNAKGGKGFGEAISHRIRDLLLATSCSDIICSGAGFSVREATREETDQKEK